MQVTLPAKVAFDVWKAGGDMAGGHDTASVPAEVAHIVKGGHQAILANGNDRNWYLNDGYGNGELVLWNAVYALDPLNGTAEFGLTPAQEKLVIGGRPRCGARRSTRATCSSVRGRAAAPSRSACGARAR